MPLPASPLRVGRFVVAAFVAAAVVMGGAHWLLRRELDASARSQEQRRGIASLNALSTLLGLAGEDSEKLRAAATAFQERRDEVRSVKVLLFSGASLEHSTAPEDKGDRAAPRRLSKDEKPFYDLGQKLRAAVETNREEGAARKDEIVTARRDDGALTLSGPLASGADPQIVGMVELVSSASEAPREPSWVWLELLLVSIAVVGVLAGALARSGSKHATDLAAALGALVLAAAVLAQGHLGNKALADARQSANDAMGAHVKELSTLAAGLSQTVGLDGTAGIKPGLWDTDVLRRPRGALAEDGSVAATRVDPPLFERTPVALALTAALLFALVALGGVHWLARTVSDNRVAYAYISPAMIGMGLLVFFPFLYGITLSFTSSSLYNADKSLWTLLVGFENYKDILFNFDVVSRSAEGGFVVNYTNFYWTLLFTIVWTITNVTIGVTLGLALALALNIKGLAFRPIYRVLLILPWAVPNYITALIWKGMFHRQFGVINHLIALFGGEPQSWFDTPLKAFATALTTNGWLSFPFMMVVSLGALQSIPDELYEAAEVDGASRWQQFLAITLPALRPALVPAIILSVVWTFNMFNIIYLVTGGEPGGATEILVTQAYKHAFERYRYGYAAAYSTVIFLILLAYGVFQNRVSRATEA